MGTKVEWPTHKSKARLRRKRRGLMRKRGNNNGTV